MATVVAVWVSAFAPHVVPRYTTTSQRAASPRLLDVSEVPDLAASLQQSVASTVGSWSLPTIDTSAVGDAASSLASFVPPGADAALKAALDAASPALEQLRSGELASSLQALSYTQQLEILTPVAAVIALLLARADGAANSPATPYPTGVYDAVSARRYFQQRPLQVATRALELTARSAGFGARLAGDALGGKLKDNADTRAAELAQLLTRLGVSHAPPRPARSAALATALATRPRDGCSAAADAPVRQSLPLTHLPPAPHGPVLSLAPPSSLFPPLFPPLVAQPTFIKAGQSASIRTDLLPPAYITGLTQLQDDVPPFSDDEARATIAHELGAPASTVFSSLGAAPVAAASLGQVYRGTLPNGTDVAVKVQRPEMESQIALDMHLLRDYAAPLAKALLQVPGDLVGTADGERCRTNTRRRQPPPPSPSPSPSPPRA